MLIMINTLFIIKPDAVYRKLIGVILSRFESKGFIFKKLKLVSLDQETAAKLYEPHKDKPFFNELIDFITSGPVIISIVEGKDAVNVVRHMIGSTKSYEAEPGTIRGDFGLDLTANIIHASDSEESFIRESSILFPDTK